MRKVLVAAFAIILAFGGAGPLAARKPPGSSTGSRGSSTVPKVHVGGYYRRNGTYVGPHDRAYQGAGRHSYTPDSLGSAPNLALPPAGGGPIGRAFTPFSSGTPSLPGLKRDSHGRPKRGESVKDYFKRQHPCPSTGRSSGPCVGYIIDHIVPVCASGPDAAYNMQWQTTAQSKERDRWERTQRNVFPKR